MGFQARIHVGEVSYGKRNQELVHQAIYQFICEVILVVGQS